MVDHKVMRKIKAMTNSERFELLKMVVKDMAERNNAEEIAQFLNVQGAEDYIDYFEDK
jgi:hypothetical protein